MSWTPSDVTRCETGLVCDWRSEVYASDIITRKPMRRDVCRSCKASQTPSATVERLDAQDQPIVSPPAPYALG
jgi:hypothetical protein